jgi:hypothetical protein
MRMTKRLQHAALAMAAISFCAAEAIAAGAVTLNKGREARRPSIAADDKGVLHVAYEAFEAGAKVPDIYYASSKDGGKTWSRGANVSKTPGLSNDPAIAAGEGGLLVIVWLDTSAGEKNPDVWGIHSTDSGKTWSKPVDISQTPGVSAEPAVAVAPGGAVHVVWTDTSEGEKSPDVWYSGSADKGATWSKAFNISQTPGISRQPAVAAGAQGDVYVTWADTSSGEGSPDIYFTASKDGGKTWAKSLDVSNTPGTSSNPDIAADEKGVYLTWADTSSGQNSPDIYVSASRDRGATFSKPVDISNTEGISSDPAIAVRDGKIAVVWCDSSGHEENPDVFAAVSSDQGQTFSKAVDVSNTPGISRLPDVTIARGQVCAVWEEEEKGKRLVKFVSSPLP